MDREPQPRPLSLRFPVTGMTKIKTVIPNEFGLLFEAIHYSLAFAWLAGRKGPSSLSRS
jgi:hypothetical protein